VMIKHKLCTLLNLDSVDWAQAFKFSNALRLLIPHSYIDEKKYIYNVFGLIF
jgi:hypothetical protein